MRAFLGLLLVVLGASTLASCGGERGQPPAGRHQRIISLIPSLTEDLFAIGAGAQVVGVSSATNYPPAARSLPVVASFSGIDAEKVVVLHPDLIVGIPAQRRLTTNLERIGIPAVFFRDDSFADIFTDLQGLGLLSGHSREASEVVRRLRARTTALRNSVNPARRARCFFVLGVSPIYTVGRGSYMTTLLEVAGGRNAGADLPAAYGAYSAEALIRADPDCLISDPQTGLPAVLGREPWRSLRATKRHLVFIIPNADVLERPGPRYNEGLAWLIARLRTAARAR